MPVYPTSERLVPARRVVLVSGWREPSRLVRPGLGLRALGPAAEALRVLVWPTLGPAARMVLALLVRAVGVGLRALLVGVGVLGLEVVGRGVVRGGLGLESGALGGGGRSLPWLPWCW
ncbi:hypothetical protein ACQPYH_07360 [Kribbella sp. CA-245084]|uniref:hypothetical protein n=1 Tax=Kribbella sp. CA-245084 TaxID=3239940 RepID=UPI003D9149AF